MVVFGIFFKVLEAKMKMKSLKMAIVRPFVIAIIIIVVAFMWLWNFDYRWVSINSSEKIVESIVKNTESRMVAFFSEPININQMLVTQVENEKMYDEMALDHVESLFLKVYESIYQNVPQVSNISYGDEQKRYLGMREGDVGVFNLMLQDSRTNMDLVIYEGTNASTASLAVIEAYSPLERPWYKPAKDQNKQIWTDVYINADEKMEATISTSIPIRSETKVVKGVICLDVKLSGIHEFLASDTSIGNGIIFILDGEGNVLEQSVNKPTMIRNESDPANSTFIKGNESDLPILKEAVLYLENKGVQEIPVERILIDNKPHFLSFRNLEGVGDLNWKIGVVIPEEDLVGNMKQRQVLVSIAMMITVIVGSVIMSFWLSRIIKPIIDSTKMATDISKGLWGTEIHLGGAKIKETDDLVKGFNVMSVSLKQSFEEIRKKEAQYRLLVENVEDMIYSFKPDGGIISVNQSFAKQLRIDQDKASGVNINTLFTNGGISEKIHLHLEAFKTNPEKTSFIIDYKPETGKRRIFNVTWIPVFDKKGNVESILGTNVNVTELIEAQENLEKVYQSERLRLEGLLTEKDETLSLALVELIEKEKMASLGNLVSGVAHEINTPLGVAVSASSFMENTQKRILSKIQSQSLTKKELMDYLEKVDETTTILTSNLNRAAELVKSFKAIAIDQHMDDNVSVHMRAYIDTILLSLKHEYKNKGHVIEVDCDSSLIVYTKPGAISQIVTNLLMNSLIHAYDEGVAGHIKISVKAYNDYVLLEYEDDGRGMSPEVLAHMYEPFFTTNRGKGGSGLGLNIVYNLVKHQLKGSIDAISEEGKFARFTIEIPKGEETDGR